MRNSPLLNALTLTSALVLGGCIAEPTTDDHTDPNFEWDVMCFDYTGQPTHGDYTNWFCVSNINPCDDTEQYATQCMERCDLYDDTHSACDTIEGSSSSSSSSSIDDCNDHPDYEYHPVCNPNYHEDIHCPAGYVPKPYEYCLTRDYSSSSAMSNNELLF